MAFEFRVSLLLLASSLSLSSAVLSPVQSSASVLNASQSSAETEARTLVEKYFALYAAKDLDGLMGLWSAKLPDPAGKRKALGSQLETPEVIFSGLTISRVKIEGERASLRCVLDMTTT